MLPAPVGRTFTYRFGLVDRRVVASAACIAALAVAGCGGGERQDANEPEGEFPVEISKAKFPQEQRLAETNDLVLSVKNTGEETIPDLAITIFISDSGEVGGADGSFSIRLDRPGLASPNRPVWILENKFPQVEGEPIPTGTSSGRTAQTNTFAFDSLEPGDERTITWRVTAVIKGTYTLNYQVAAGLQGKARAVTDDGSEASGNFTVTIDNVPPETRVNDAGKVVEVK